MTGLRVSEFDQLLDDLAPAYGQAEQQRLSRSVSMGLGHRRREITVAPGCLTSLSPPVQAG
jgi:hypothetical protein